MVVVGSPTKPNSQALPRAIDKRYCCPGCFVRARSLTKAFSLPALPILAAMDFAQYSATREQMFVLLKGESLKSPCHNDRYFHNADDTAAQGTSKATASISPDPIPIWPEPKMKVIRHDAIGAADIRLGVVAQPVSRRWARAF